MIKHEIEQWLIQIWHPISIEKVDTITFIVANLGLSHTYDFLRSECNQVASEKIRLIIAETIAELEGNVEDPYTEINIYMTN